MIPRVLTVGVVLFWAASMSWLVRHDLLPAWTARDVPKFDAGDWLTEDNLRSQARIEDKYGRRIGTVWTEYTRGADRVARRDVVWLENFSVAPRLRIESTADFTTAGDLDAFELYVYGAGERIALKGENFSGSLAFELCVGTHRQTLKVDAAVHGMLGDVFRPFPTLPRVAVGQSWRMHVINPLAAVSGIGTKLIPMLVRVTHTEPFATAHGPIECFVVETERARAWVDATGVVLKQQVDLPVGGTISVVAEPFDEALRTAVCALDLPSGFQ